VLIYQPTYNQDILYISVSVMHATYRGHLVINHPVHTGWTASVYTVAV